MEGFSAEAFTSTLALVGVVILVAALLSGFIEKTGLPQVAFFLALGAALGPAGLGLININLGSPALRIVATLSLVLVLFTDAVTLDLSEVRKHSTLALLVLGPGTLLSAALIALTGWWLLGLPVAGAAILGAALASTDPVLLRGLLRRPEVPGSARQALRLESGLNDVVLLPIVLVALTFLDTSSEMNAEKWAKLALDLLLLGPGAGVAVGLFAVATMDLLRRRIGIRRDYESLYSIGIALTAYAAAEAVHGSGFLAAFAAGLTVSALDVELCDCFLEYGETTAEMALLLTFVLFGGSLIWSGFVILTPLTILFAVLVLLIRPVAFLASLAGTKLSKKSRYLIAWFGPRGLSSLLLVLLAVFAQAPGSQQLFSICCLVVLLSIVLHGGTPLVLARTATARARSAVAVQTVPASPPADSEKVLAQSPEILAQLPDKALPIPTPSTADNEHKAANTRQFPSLPILNIPLTNSSSLGKAAADGKATTVAPANPDEADYEPARHDKERISLDEVRQLWEQNDPVIVLDVRTERSLGKSETQAQGAIRLNPVNAVKDATALNLPKDNWLIAYCA